MMKIIKMVAEIITELASENKFEAMGADALNTETAAETEIEETGTGKSRPRKNVKRKKIYKTKKPHNTPLPENDVHGRSHKERSSKRLSDDQKKEIISEVKSGKKKRLIAEAYGVSEATIYNIIGGAGKKQKRSVSENGRELRNQPMRCACGEEFVWTGYELDAVCPACQSSAVSKI